MFWPLSQAARSRSTAASSHGYRGHASEEGVRKAADRLVRQGIVKQRHMGRIRMYALNREHLAAEPVQRLATLRAQLIERLRQRLTTWDVPAAAAVLFGSVSRKTASETSDLDILRGARANRGRGRR